MPDEPSEKPSSDKRKSFNGYQDCYDKLKSLKDKKVAIFTHACPDPDAIGSMMGMNWMLQRAFNLEADMFYAGEVSHPQNGVMNNLLDPGLKRIDQYDPSKYGFSVLVDTIPENAGVPCNTCINFGLVIDHHRDLPHNYNGVLVHRKCGSCAAIVYDLIKHFVPAEEMFNEDIDGDTKVATALITGIVTDTLYMMSDDSTELEFKAFSELFKFRNSNFLKQIVFFKRPKFWIDRKAEACVDAEVNDEGYAVVGLGIIPEKQRDLIADMADEMVQWASVETAIAFAVVGGDRIEGSVRSLNASLTVSDFCEKLAGKHGKGGGKHGKGAYKLPLGGLSIDIDEDDADIAEAWESIKKRETKRILRTIKV